ncbi:penicillin-binding protein [Chroococcidiopsis sp. CCALA 051]|uniref:transglycosylase domain-containing protein n=1 Tax=Chroococcidiopsis sp. CCALA 051 TaxID=869949 RepID=UPI000D0CE01E|nr:transglycosylase domain-containing protein [Chroococcidiopsis sp. CCALA 051]PSM46303.1 penicillin-binding protein [Chroococcidiopsis sp. CCALA 051]
MTPPQPPRKPQTLLSRATQVVKTLQAKVQMPGLALKPNARVAELWIQDAGTDKAETYPLLGDRYLIGRSAKSCDIVVRNPVVSQIHLSLARDTSKRRSPFVLRDENSTNGIYWGKRRVAAIELHHGDVFTLGPPELAAAVRMKFHNPPPQYVRTLQWVAGGIGGVTALLAIVVGYEWTKFSVTPLPAATGGPTIVFARDGETMLRQPRSTAHTDLKSLQDFSTYLPKAIIASEDSRYYWHFGVDPIGILRATVVNVGSREFEQGASTVTQQVSRSIFRSYVGAEDSLGRKLREAVVALKLETFYSKDFILLMYLNRVFLGADTYGFEDAARFYFDKSAKELNLSEAATLVGILPSPNGFNFCGDVRSNQKAIEYRNRVISRMLAQGMVTTEEANRARRSQIEVSSRVCEAQANTIAPYFYNAIFQELQAILGKELAAEGNYIVETQLDPDMQAKAEEALRNSVRQAGASIGYSQGAVVTLDAGTGAVLAMVGGTDYKTSQFNRVTQAQRQPGSAFKLFTYAAAIEKGISPSKYYSCAPVSWQGQRFRGCVRGSDELDVATGLALSENPIALRVAQDVGLDSIMRVAQRLGIQSPLQPVPGLVLGQSETNLLEMTGAYGAIANDGVWNRPHLIMRILDSSDCGDRQDLKTCREIYAYNRTQTTNRRILSPGVAQTVTSMLRGVVERGTGTAANIGIGEEAGKTGTSGLAARNQNFDLWFIGFLTREKLVTGVWLGNDNNAPVSGYGVQAARLWGSYMREVVQ